MKIFLENLFLNDLKENDELKLQHKLLLASSVVRELTRYEEHNMTELKIDIANSLQITENTLQSFAEIFSSSLGKSIRSTHQQEVVGEHLTLGPLARYCALLLAVPNWKSEELKSIDISLCDGIKPPIPVE